jgi:hypothetical protein
MRPPLHDQHTMTPNTADWERLCDLAANGPQPGEFEAAAAFIAECERLTDAARELIAPSPHATSPAKARMTRWVKPQPNEAKTRPEPLMG